MNNCTIQYENDTIFDSKLFDAFPSSYTLATAGKVCEDDIVVNLNVNTVTVDIGLESNALIRFLLPDGVTETEYNESDPGAGRFSHGYIFTIPWFSTFSILTTTTKNYFYINGTQMIAGSKINLGTGTRKQSFLVYKFTLTNEDLFLN